MRTTTPTMRHASSDSTYEAESRAPVTNAVPYGAHHGPSRGQAKLGDKYMRMSVDETMQALDVSSVDQGLDTQSIDALQEKYGMNELEANDPEPLWLRWIYQFKEPMNALLVGSAVVSVLVGQTDDAVCITLALAIVITVGIAQEYRSEKSLEALNNLVPPKCRVIRSARTHTLEARELVPGDVVCLSSGDRVPADVRIVKSQDFEVNESALTGETSAVRKSADDTDQEPTNLAYMGTLVEKGSATGIVYGTGIRTEFGNIFGMVDSVDEKQTPLQISMSGLAQRLSVFSLGLISLLLLVGLVQQKSWIEMFTIAVSLAVAAIPEGLPIVVTVTLALGALEMSHRKAIVKRLPSVETLGCMSVICSDKTGTLTTGHMRVIQLFTVPDGIVEVGKDARRHELSPAMTRNLYAGFFCNNATMNEQGQLVGQATEVAMAQAPESLGLSLSHKDWTRTNEVPFDSERKFMAVTGHGDADKTPGEAQLMKGAPEAVLKHCTTYMAQRPSQLTDQVRSDIQDTISKLTQRGLRVLATAVSTQGRHYTFCGLQAMQDPPREQVHDAIKTLQRGRIHVIMITGDAETTARAIAQQLGLASSPNVMTGSDIESLSERQLRERVRNVSVFARTKPEHKLRIVSALQANNEVVGMTGDGVNDAPALKLADVGISMGSGTDVTKEAADVILVNDNFATIMGAVREGKCIFYNIQNFVTFQLSTSAAALMLISLSTILQLRFPLNAMQILFINILMDGPPSQSLGVDPAHERVMQRPPRAKDAPVLTSRLFLRIAFSAAVMIILTYVVFLTGYTPTALESSLDKHESTVTFTCFVMLALVCAIQSRGLYTGLFDNHMLLWTTGLSFGMQLLIIYVPILQSIFLTEALGLNDFSYLISIAIVGFGLQECRRIYERYLEDKSQDLGA